MGNAYSLLSVFFLSQQQLQRTKVAIWGWAWSGKALGRSRMPAEKTDLASLGHPSRAKGINWHCWTLSGFTQQWEAPINKDWQEGAASAPRCARLCLKNGRVTGLPDPKSTGTHQNTQQVCWIRLKALQNVHNKHQGQELQERSPPRRDDISTAWFTFHARGFTGVPFLVETKRKGTYSSALIISDPCELSQGLRLLYISPAYANFCFLEFPLQPLLDGALLTSQSSARQRSPELPLDGLSGSRCSHRSNQDWT